MYRCITGITPEESVERVRRDNVVPPSAMGISIDQRKETALMMGMAVLQDKRFQSIPAIYSAMYGQQLQQTTIPTASQGAVPAPVQSPPSQPPQGAVPAPGAPVAPPPPYQPQGAAAPIQPQPYRPQGAAMPAAGAAPPFTPPQKSGSWISNNKALAGVLGGVILLVVALGVFLLIMFLPKSSTPGNDGQLGSDPPPTGGVPSPSATSLDNTTWELHELDISGLILSREYLESEDSIFMMWFSSNGDFVGDFHAGGMLFGT